MDGQLSSFYTRWMRLSLAIGLLFTALLFYYHQFPGDYIPDQFPRLNIPQSTESRPPTIPNIVHFVHLVPSSSDPTFEFEFRQFIAIYSAWHYLQPETIYVHTNIKEQLINEALSRATSPYTKSVQQIPRVKFNHRIAPNQTESGNVIDNLPNQSDFVRTAVLLEQGGIYLDDDSYVLRDLTPLRTLGFENVVGKQITNQICPAVLMSTPRNKMMEAYHALQDKAFSPGNWAAHAVDLLTKLVREFQIPKRQVLVLSQEAFFPLSWLPTHLKDIYAVHNDTEMAIVDKKDENSQNLIEYIEDFELKDLETWRKDWRLSYVLHGWTHGIEIEGKAGELGDFGGITVDYVLAQRSNFARAVYPAVKHALEEGYDF